MNRRNFLKTTASLGIVPLLSRGLPIRSLASTSLFSLNPCDFSDRSMVVIYLNGGNDIFNTLVPLDQYSDYVGFRPTANLAQSSLITLDTSLASQQQLGMHPNLTGFKNMYDDGLLKIIQGVGYDNPNRSHFKSLDNWLKGAGGTVVPTADSGLFGRFLQDRYPGYSGTPFIGEPDPLGILLGDMKNTGFHTQEEHSYEVKLASKDSNNFYTLLAALGGDPIQNLPMTDHGDKLFYIHTVEQSVNVYSQRVADVFASGSNSNAASYPNTDLGNQLKTIARLMKGGSRTKIFMASTGGFDNHVNLLSNHEGLMSNLSTCTKAFQDDLIAMGLDSNVLTVVFSEFGRKIIENGSAGVDHGTLSSMFVVGKGVEGGVLGNNMDLSNQDGGAPHPNQTQYDYRQVFATIMQDWFGANTTSMENTFLDPSYQTQKLNLINTNNLVPSTCYFTPVAPQVCACIQVKVFLEGFYDTSLNTMRTDLNTASLLPNNQPYGLSPFNYAGTESAVSFAATIVDWLLLELRDANDLTTVIARKAALLRNDGYILEADGSVGVTFLNVSAGMYHLAVFHRNHLPILSAEAIPLNVVNYLYDFTKNTAKTKGIQQVKAIGSNYALRAGDLDANGLINNLDYNFWDQNKGQTAVYSTADINGDGAVNSLDAALWDSNRSKIGELR